MKEATYKYMVSIRCMTYNHAPYIEDAMNGFCIQETNFPFVAVIVDDASTDGEPGVIRKYLNTHFRMESARQWETDDAHFIEARHKENENCTFAVVSLKYNFWQAKKSKEPLIAEWSDTKYIALCEGDDYWTHPQKLQKQVRFLEEHEDYSCCCHRFKIYYEDTDSWDDDFGRNAFANHPFDEGLEVTNYENFLTRFTSTLTLCYRKSVVDAILWPPYKFSGKDFHFHYHLLKLGRGWCFADYMGVYRKHNGGIWSRLSSLQGARLRLECYKDLYKYNHTDSVISECYSIWLNRFYAKFVLPPFSQHKLTKSGIKGLCFYLKHCWNVKCYFLAFKNCVKCFAALLEVK